MPGAVELKNVALWCATGAVLFFATMLVYGKSLGLGLTFDDVAMLLYFTLEDYAWYDTFGPMDNGFLRPVYVFALWVTWKLGGVTDLFHRIYAMLVHSAAATVAGWAFYCMAGVGRRAAIAVAGSVAMASSAFVTVFYSSNTGDSLMACWAVVCVLGYDLWLRRREVGWLWMMGAGLLLALGSKETAVVLCGVLILQTWIAEDRRRIDWVLCAVASVVCGAFAGVVLWLQRAVDVSYANSGYSSLSPVGFAQRVVAYLASTVFPGYHVMKPAWSMGGLGPVFTMGVGVAVVAMLVLGAGLIVRRGVDVHLRKGAVLVMGALFFLLPTGIVVFVPGPDSPVGRYVYTSMVFVMMGLGMWGVWLYQKRRWMWGVAGVLWGAWLVAQPIVVRKSPGTAEYYESARQWGDLREEIGRVSRGWGPMQRIAVYTGPAYGSFVINEPYINALLRLYFPHLLIDFVSNRTTAETSLVYVFDGRRLTRVE